MESASPFKQLLKALASGSCTSELWERGAVAHYAGPKAEGARAELVRASIDAGSWDWSQVPAKLQVVARSLLASSSTWNE